MKGPTTWTALKRMILFRSIRLVSTRHGKDKSWKGPDAERLADGFLRELHVGSQPDWTWPLDVEAVLEDGTAVSCQLEMRAGVGLPLLRDRMALLFSLQAMRHSHPLEARVEFRRIAELLDGCPFPTREERRFWGLVAQLGTKNEESESDQFTRQAAPCRQTTAPPRHGGRAATRRVPPPNVNP